MLAAEQARRAMARRHQGHRVLVAVGCALAAVLLSWLYLRQAGTQPVGSDGASVELQAWDMLHGNPLLTGWAMSDVSFWPGELGEYVLLEAAGGLSPSVVHIAGALTYTVTLVLAALVAGGGYRGRTAWVAGLIAAGLMISPGAGIATRILLQEPDHFGSAVPVLLAWLAILRLPPRWYRAVLVAVVLAAGAVGDPLIYASGTAAVSLGLAISWLMTSRSGGRAPVLATLAGALASGPLAALVLALVHAAGGLRTHPVLATFAGWSAIGAHLRLSLEGAAGLFGAGFSSGPEGGSGPLVFAVVHVAGVVLVVVALLVVLIRPRLWTDPVLPGLVAAIGLLTVLFVGSGYAVDPLGVREIAVVLPFGAVIAGRVACGPAVAAWDRLRRGPRIAAAGALSVLLTGYLAGLAYAAAQPQVPAVHQQVADWLDSHGLTRGLALGYWVANSVTADTGGRTTTREIDVSAGRAVLPPQWNVRAVWYSPAASSADFVLTPDPPGTASWRGLTATFGQPVRVYHPDGYWVLVYRANLLRRLTR